MPLYLGNTPIGGANVSVITPKLQNKTVTPTTSEQIITPDTGYDGLNQVIVAAGGAGSGGGVNIATRNVSLVNTSSFKIKYCANTLVAGEIVAVYGVVTGNKTISINNMLCNSTITLIHPMVLTKFIPDDMTIVKEIDSLGDTIIGQHTVYFIDIGSSTDSTSINFASEVSCCFAPGTLVLTSLDGDATVIESVEVGDTIVSYDIETGENKIVEVSRIIVKENTTDIAEVTFNDGSTIVMNAYHPLYCRDEFKSITRYKGYDELVVGDVVKSYNDWRIITNINRYISDPIVTYNLDIRDLGENPDVDTNDTYYANGVVVKNGFC